jgi:signal transduction histidine kinase
MVTHLFGRAGLRFRMAASYVAVSAAAVIVVEVVLLALVAPLLRDASQTVDEANGRAQEANAAALSSKAHAAALEGADMLDEFAAKIVHSGRAVTDRDILAKLAQAPFAQVASDLGDLGGGGEGDAPRGGTALTAPDGRVVAVGGVTDVQIGSRLTPGTTGDIVWSGTAVTAVDPASPEKRRPVGLYLVGLDAKASGLTTADKPGDDSTGKVGEAGKDGKDGSARVGADRRTGGMLVPGIVVLGLLVPVGLVFGLLSTRPLIRRIRRLAEGTATMAAGDLRSRIPVTGHDEVSRLEQGFNAMAERLEAAVQLERDAAGSDARRAERTRIARELHDSVSQHLFSLNLLAGGMRRALPAGSELHHQAESMERTVERTMREMRAMLLELRPVGLEDAGLVAALEELSAAYEARLGIRVTAHVAELSAPAAVEHAVLRVVQEALRNAARHGAPDTVELTVSEVAGHVLVAIRDNGRGFEPARAAERHGMGLELMRERVTELGGTLDIASAPSRGTTVEARIPAGAA